MRKIVLPEGMPSLEEDRITKVENFSRTEIFRTQSGKAFSTNVELVKALNDASVTKAIHNDLVRVHITESGALLHQGLFDSLYKANADAEV